MRRRSSHAGNTPDQRSGRWPQAAVLGGAALATASVALVSLVLLAPGVSLAGATVIAIIDVALVECAITRRSVGESNRSSQRFERGFDDAAIGMLILTPKLEVQRANDAVCALLARDCADVVGKSILDFTHPEDIDRSVDWSALRFKGQDRPPLIKRYLRPDGSILEAAVITALVEPEGAESYFFSQLQNVTEQRRAERQKAAIAELGRRALEITDPTTLMIEAMQTVREILGATSCTAARRLASGEVRTVAADGEMLDFTIPAGQASQTAHTLIEGIPVVSNDLPGETRFSVPLTVIGRGLYRGLSVPVPQRSGVRHVLLAHGSEGARAFGVEDVQFLEAVAHVIGDALDRAETELELRRRALEDPLTGLANRALLSTQLESELRHARRLAQRVCLLVLDLDRFKVVNDTLGHTAGDMLLQQVAARLTACVREEDLVARPGGDEFTVVCTRTASDHAIAEVAQRLVDAVIEPFQIEGREVFITASVGLAVSEEGRETTEELLRDADAAMYSAKELGGGRFEAFDATLRQRLVERMEIEVDLRHAVERDQLELHYQPLMDLEHDRIVGFEALVRWRHPERGLIMPDEFVHIAEETGLIVPIGSWVLSAVCAQLARFPEGIHVSANLSALQIKPELVSEVERELERHGVAPERLVLEITESLVLDPRVKPIVASLRALGVQLALDDFGTGYSSLGSLQRFPLDVLKLDRSLIESVVDGRGVAVVRAAVELGRALGVSVIAEGIEGTLQLDALRDLGCQMGQGFLFARPLPLADAERLLADGDDEAGISCGIAA
jgi:diguanylate cyclase (GGDEF)-like protein/PAS domain S-box-containing protein